MNLFFSNKIKIFLSSLIAAVVLLLAVFWGIGQGQKISQAKSISQTASSTIAALKFFYMDQGRYPTADEFGSQSLMLNYLSNFPLPDYPSASCAQSFVYKRPDPQTFTLSFCLPIADPPYAAGWNNIGN